MVFHFPQQGLFLRLFVLLLCHLFEFLWQKVKPPKSDQQLLPPATRTTQPRSGLTAQRGAELTAPGRDPQPGSRLTKADPVNRHPAAGTANRPQRQACRKSRPRHGSPARTLTWMRPRRWRNFSFTAAFSSVRALSGPGQSRMSWKTTAPLPRPAAGLARLRFPAQGGGRSAALAGRTRPGGEQRYLHGRLDLQVELDDLLVADPHRHTRGRRHAGSGSGGCVSPPGLRAPPAGAQERPGGSCRPGAFPARSGQPRRDSAGRDRQCRAPAGQAVPSPALPRTASGCAVQPCRASCATAPRLLWAAKRWCVHGLKP